MPFKFIDILQKNSLIAIPSSSTNSSSLEQLSTSRRSLKLPKSQMLINSSLILDPVKSYPPPRKLLHQDGNQVRRVGQWMSIGIQSLLKFPLDISILLSLITCLDRNEIFCMMFLFFLVRCMSKSYVMLLHQYV